MSFRTNVEQVRDYFHRWPTHGESQLRPQRWNWSQAIRPLDERLSRQMAGGVGERALRNLRFFWLDGVFSASSEAFYLTFIPLYALALGATTGQIGGLTAVTNALGALAFFPGARLAERLGRRKPLILISGGTVARLALLVLALMPFFVRQPLLAVGFIIALAGVRSLANNLANPAWTSLVADLVPDERRGRYFGSRNMAMGVATLALTPLAGRLIGAGNLLDGSGVAGYQIALAMAFGLGVLGTLSFARIEEPVAMAPVGQAPADGGHLWTAVRAQTGYIGFVISAFVFNLALQIAAPFFNVYLVKAFDAGPTIIGIVAAISSLSALFGSRVFSRLVDEKGNVWVAQRCGLLIPVLPLAWIVITAPWQVGLINTLGGFIWAGYNLATFNLLLQLTPDVQRPRAVALYQTAVFSSAVIGPLLGGTLAEFFDFTLLFGLSGIGRLVGVVLFVWLTARPLRRLGRG